MVSDISSWLGWKLSVNAFYMGLPKDHFLWKLFNVVTGASRRLRFLFLKDQCDVLRWMFVAKFRRNKYAYSQMLRNQGRIVLFDRYPLKEFWGMDEPMDGPRLGESSRWRNVERRFYDEVKYPDYVFVLKVDEKESVHRKAEHENQRKREVIRKKITALDNLVRTKNDRFIVIDTLRGKEQTKLEIRRRLWGLL